MNNENSKKYIFLEPFKYENQFIDELKKTYSELGHTVVPFESFRQYSSIPKSSKIAVINWLEDQPSYNKSHFQAFLDFLRVVKKALLIRSKMQQGIWIQHNFRPHHRRYGQTAFKLTQSLFTSLHFKKLVMEKYAIGMQITHPLYLSDEHNLALRQELVNNTPATKQGVLFFGAIKKYKNLHEILSSWPCEVPMSIIGRAESQEYADELKGIIDTRKLNITIENRFIENDELDLLLKAHDWVLIPHANNTMVASGSFYHAISYGCNVICNQSEFGLLKSSQHNFVQVICLESFSNHFLQQHFVPKQAVLNEVLTSYGENIRKKQWRQVLSD